MKMSKLSWDKSFLQLIETRGSYEVIEALDPYYNAFRKENETSRKINKDYAEAIGRVKHLENKETLTEEEYNEWQSSVSWFENVGEEIGYREESLAVGLIIGIWKPVNNLALTVASGLKSRSIASVKDRFSILRMGPKIKSEYWAHALNAASNYVRHSDEWNKNLSKYIRNGTNGKWELDIPDRFNNTKMNLKILENIGLDVETLVSSNNIAYTVAAELGIIDKQDVNSAYLSWVKEVHSFTKTQLNIK